VKQVDWCKDELLDREQITRRLGGWFEHAPGFVAILRGPRFVFETANKAYHQLVGHRNILDKPIFDALPDMCGQGFEQELKTAFETGRPFVGKAVKVRIRREAERAPVEAVLDFVYQPMLDDAGDVWGILVQGHDVSEEHRMIDGGASLAKRIAREPAGHPKTSGA
jgi:hypothetical protein